MKNKKQSLEKTLIKLTKEIKAGKILSMKELVSILKELSLRELKPGGPYQELDEKIPGTKLNLAIFKFLETQDVSLPNLTKFLGKNNLIESKTQELNSGKTNINKKKQSKNKKNAQELAQEKNEQEEIRKIFKLASLEYSDLDKNLGQELIKVIKQTAKNNPDKQMLLMPFYFYQSLKLAPNKEKEALVTKLGLINAYFWAAFIIYDDFWDEDEKAKPSLLPLANLMSRELVNFYFSFFRDYQGYSKYITRLLNGADNANYFETKNCRFINPLKTKGDKLNLKKIELISYGDYEIKFLPAATHLLGPLVIMASLGFKINDPKIKALENFFRHYLIARQLNDDLHDFEEDLSRGHLSPAINETFKEAKRLKLNLVSEAELKKIFWLKTLKTLSQEIIKEINLAEKELKKIKIIKNQEPLLKLCDLAKNSAYQALGERKKSLDFIKHL